MADTIGQYLKECREKQDLSLEKLSEKTHIKLRILKQLESDEFEDLGGVGYIKSFILSYGRAVNANVPKLLLMFDTLYKDKQVRYYRVEQTEPKKVLIPTSVFYIILLIILIAFLSYITIRLHNEGKLTTPKLNKITSTINLKDIFKKKEPIEKVEVDTTKAEAVEEHSINREALFDTTDYSNDLIFQGEDSPLNKE